MNRRELLQSFSAGMLVPFNGVIPQQAESGQDETKRFSTAILTSDATDRILKSYEVHHNGQKRVEWVLQKPDGEVLYRTEYPLHRLSEEYHNDALVLEYFSEPPDRELRGRSYIGLRADNVYHKHIRARQNVVTYRQNIHTGSYERIQ